MNDNIIPDPEFAEFNGSYIGVPNAPKLTHNLQALVRYMEETKKAYSDLTQEEIDNFKLNENSPNRRIPNQSAGVS